MESKDDNYNELADMVDNLFLTAHRISFLENKPRYYGGDILLYPNEVYTLKAIAQEEGINQTALSEKMVRTKGATSVVVRKLKQKNLIIQKENEHDLRMYELYTTPDGKQVYQRHLQYDMQYVERLASELGVSMEELAQANRILRMLNKNFIRRYHEKGEDAFLEPKSE